MAIDNNVMTLADYAKVSNSPIVNNVAMSLYNFGSVMRDWGMITNPSLQAKGVRLKNGGLPSVGWRKINESTTVTKATFDPFSEQAYILSNAIDTDIKLIQDNNQIGGPGRILGQQLDAYFEAVAYDVNDKFFNNSHVTGDIDAPVGIRTRLDAPTEYGVESSCKINCGGVDISLANLTAATARSFLYYLDKGLDELGSPEGEGVVLYVNRDLRRLIDAAVKSLGAGGGFDMTQDAFDRRVLAYRNAIVRTVGVKADGTTDIITSTETAAGANGSSTFSSFYMVKYGDTHLQPWQMNELTVEDIGKRSDEPNMYRLFVDWGVGFMQTHTRSIVRGYNVKVS